MTRDENDDLRHFRRWLLGLVAGLLAIVAVAVAASHILDLYWYPWEISQRTQMIRQSNSYVTTQQAALRQLRSAYDDAGTTNQKAAIVRQMTEIADLIPGNTQPDIAAFLAGEH